MNNSLHLAWKYGRIFVCGHCLFREANSFLTPCEQSLFSLCLCRKHMYHKKRLCLQGVFHECSSRKTMNYEEQIMSFKSFSQHMQFWKLGIFSDIPQFYLGNIQSYDMFRPIVCKRKYLMDYRHNDCLVLCLNSYCLWLWAFGSSEIIQMYHLEHLVLECSFNTSFI